MDGGSGTSTVPTVIRAARVVDVARSTVLTDHDVVVRNDRIETLRPSSPDPPPDGRLIELPRHTLLPGLIDCHAHLVGEPDTGRYSAPLERSGAQEAMSGIRNARATLMAGFTSVRDVGTYRAFVDVALRDAIDEGIVPGPRMQVAGPT